MPRIDAPGAVHHIIIRGIERRPIFRSNSDRGDLLQRLGRLLPETQTECFDWALIPNHAHFLLRTAKQKIPAAWKVIPKPVQVDSVSGGCLPQRACPLYSPQFAARRVGEGFKSAGSVSLRELGMSTVELAGILIIGQSAISRSVQRGEKIAGTEDFAHQLEEIIKS